MSFIRHRRATSPNKFECRNVYSTNHIDVATSKRTCFVHYMCGLNDRRASALDEKMLLQVDYTNARLAIQKEKVHSLKYLNEAIQSCGDSVG